MSIFLQTEAEKPKTVKAATPGSYVAEPSRFAKYLWDRRKDATAIKSAVTDVCKEVEGDRVGWKVKKYSSELFGTIYGDATPVDNEEAPGFATLIHDALREVPQFQRLMKSVAGDADFSALATADVLSEMAPTLGDALRRQEQEQENREQGKPQPSGPTAQELLAAAASAAVKEATSKHTRTKAAMAGIAPGLERAPSLGEQADSNDRMALAQILRDDALVRRVIRRAGRVMRRSGRESRKSDGREEVIDIERGHDISRLLPSELSMLADEDLEILTLQKLIMSTALQYQLEGTSPIGRGPMIVLVDRSGSMRGAPLEIASSITIALAMIACREKRAVSVIYFDGHAHDSIQMTGATPAALVKLCGHVRRVSAGGGTNFTAAFRAGLRELKEMPRADIVFVTDDNGQSVSKQVYADLEKEKQAGLRIWGVTINRGAVSELVKGLCAEVISLDGGDPDQAASRLIAGVAG